MSVGKRRRRQPLHPTAAGWELITWPQFVDVSAALNRLPLEIMMGVGVALAQTRGN